MLLVQTKMVLSEFLVLPKRFTMWDLLAELNIFQVAAVKQTTHKQLE